MERPNLPVTYHFERESDLRHEGKKYPFRFNNFQIYIVTSVCDHSSVYQLILMCSF